MPKCTRCDGHGLLRSDEMECSEFDYSKCDACGGSGNREDQLKHYIRSNQERHQKDSVAETKKWMDELVKIEERKPMPPMLGTNDLPPGHFLLFDGEPAFGKVK